MLLNPSAADRRYSRYLAWLGEYLFNYPACIQDEEERRLAVRFLGVLDNAAALLSNQRLDRLLRLLEHLWDTGGFLPAALTSSLLALPEADFSNFVTRRIAKVVEDPGVGVKARADDWRRSFCCDGEPGTPDETLSAVEDRYLTCDRPYDGMLIDRYLDASQIQRLNRVPGIRVGSTCAGHPERASVEDSTPTFSFTVPGKRPRAEKAAARLARKLGNDDTEARAAGAWVHVRSRVVNTGRNQAELLAWWDAAISRLESAACTGRRGARRPAHVD